jgi:hypothetical protein
MGWRAKNHETEHDGSNSGTPYEMGVQDDVGR